MSAGSYGSFIRGLNAITGRYQASASLAKLLKAHCLSWGLPVLKSLIGSQPPRIGDSTGRHAILLHEGSLVEAHELHKVLQSSKILA